MGFGEQLRRRRKELGYSREELAQKLGITGSAVGNYETGVSAPRESVLLRLFDVLQVEPNYLYRDFYAAGRRGEGVSSEEASLLRKYRELGLTARQTLELTETLRGKEKKGSLLWVLDKTIMNSLKARSVHSSREKDTIVIL